MVDSGEVVCTREWSSGRAGEGEIGAGCSSYLEEAQSASAGSVALSAGVRARALLVVGVKVVKSRTTVCGVGTAQVGETRRRDFAARINSASRSYTRKRVSGRPSGCACFMRANPSLLLLR